MLDCYSQEINKKDNSKKCNINNIKLFVNALKKGSSPNAELYKSYIFINEPGKPDRNSEGIKYYTDTLFNEMQSFLNNYPSSIYSLSSARKKFGSQLYNYYYDGQKNSIFVIAIKVENVYNFYYCYMYFGKVVSLMPSKVADHSIVGWK